MVKIVSNEWFFWHKQNFVLQLLGNFRYKSDLHKSHTASMVTMVITSYPHHIHHQCVTMFMTSFIFVRKLKKRIKKLRKTLINILFCFILYCSLPLLHTRSLASSKSLMLVFCPQELEPSSSVDYGTILLIVWKSVAAPSNSSFCPGES